ncbi:MAG: hypothetical protein PHY82_10405 [Lentisphaeria bacterium]|nr:hypothetical protein [Lentisphaeria bacterium]
MEFYHAERPHQSLGNKPFRPEDEPGPATGRIACRERPKFLSCSCATLRLRWSLLVPEVNST